MTKLLPYSSFSQSLFLLLICRICGFQGCTTKYRNSNQRSVTKLRKQLDNAEGVKPYWKPGAKCCCSAHLAALRALVAIKPVLYVLSECKLTECFDGWDCLISAVIVSGVISWILMPPLWPSLIHFATFVCHRCCIISLMWSLTSIWDWRRCLDLLFLHTKPYWSDPDVCSVSRPMNDAVFPLYGIAKQTVYTQSITWLY